jgi:hypothetical protein
MWRRTRELSAGRPPRRRGRVAPLAALALLGLWAPRCHGAGRAGDAGESEGSPPARGVLLTFQAGAGRDSNVFLTPTNTVPDGFAETSARVEWDGRPHRLVSLYVAASADAREYPRNTAANERDAGVELDARIGPNRLTAAIEDEFIHRKYQLFDERGVPLAAGDSESAENELRFGGRFSPAPGAELSVLALRRTKDYAELELDFDETGIEAGAGAGAAWGGLSLAGTYGERKYRSLRAARAEGTDDGTGPVLAERLRRVQGRFERPLPDGGRADLSLAVADCRDTFEGEGSYAEVEGRAGVTVAAGKLWAVSLDIRAGRRAYERRTPPGSGTAQRDVFFDAGVMVERRVWREVSAYVAGQEESRRSGDPRLAYRATSLSAGLRGML